jgi:palmitoyl-protein thioesterase
MLSLIAIIICFIHVITISGSPPIVLWHGMGDSCCNPLSLGSVIKLIKKQLPDAYVLSLRIGSNIIEDTSNGFFMNANHQIDYACKILNADKNLSQGYHAIG